MRWRTAQIQQSRTSGLRPAAVAVTPSFSIVCQTGHRAVCGVGTVMLETDVFRHLG
jgi:hypothetical protein